MAIKQDLVELKLELGGDIEKIKCTQEETEQYRVFIRTNKPLPDDIFLEDPCESFETFYKIKNNDLSKEELYEYLQYKKLKHLKTIKNCVVFFTVLTAISLVIGFISGFISGCNSAF